MKRLFAAALVLAAALALWGCSDAQQSMSVPSAFYYVISEKDSPTAIGSELRETAGCEKNLITLMARYLSGPVSDHLISAVPADVTVETITGNRVCITVYMSSRFAELTGMDLTVACACISMTLLEYTGADEVKICVRDCLLDGSKYIYMTRDSLILQDIT